MASKRDPADAIRHVAHEVVWCAGGARGRVIAEAGVVVHDDYRDMFLGLAFEACLLHARNLIEFLIPTVRKGSHPDDVKAVELVDHWECPPGPARSFVESQLPLLDRHLAHLTWHRVENPPDSAGLPYWKVAVTLVELMDDFASHAVA